MPEGAQVNRMFAGIAGRYDLANTVLSGGVDLYWRQVLVSMVAARKPQEVVDLATGSGDVAFALKKRLGANARVRGMDFCAPMLEEAEKKKAKRQWAANVDFSIGDCLDLPLEDASVDVLTISFGLRNLEDRHKGLQEMRRVLRPGGALLCLEFTQPDAWMRPFYYVYLKHLLPRVAKTLTRSKDAYDYLAMSIESFPAREDLSGEMQRAGFGFTRAKALTGGIVAIHEAEK